MRSILVRESRLFNESNIMEGHGSCHTCGNTFREESDLIVDIHLPSKACPASEFVDGGVGVPH